MRVSFFSRCLKNSFEDFRSWQEKQFFKTETTCVFEMMYFYAKGSLAFDQLVSYKSRAIALCYVVTSPPLSARKKRKMIKIYLIDFFLWLCFIFFSWLEWTGNGSIYMKLNEKWSKYIWSTFLCDCVFLRPTIKTCGKKTCHKVLSSWHIITPLPSYLLGYIVGTTTI